MDSATYFQFINKDYDGLWKTGKDALKNKIDFYFLRTRLGISYYEYKSFEKALIHFKKAHEMSPADSLIQEYLYFSYLFTNRLEDAKDLAFTFAESMKKRVGFKSQPVVDVASSFKSVSVTAGLIFKIPVPMTKEMEELIYSEKTIQNNASLFNLFIENRTNSRFTFINSFSFFNVKSEGIVEAQSSRAQTKNYSNNNYQYTLGGRYVTTKNLSIGASLGYFKENAQFITSDFIDPSTPFNIQTFNSNNTAYTGMANIFKRHLNFGFGISAGLGNLGNVFQIQTEGTFLWYPRGNTDFYSSTSLSWLNNDETNQSVFTQKIGGKARKKLWYEVKASYGNHQNYITNGGIVAYNTIEPVKFTAETSFSFFLRKLKIIPSYTMQVRESSYFKIVTPSYSETSKKNYLNQLIKCTIQFNF